MKYISLFFLKHPLSVCDIHYAIISSLIYDHNIFIATAVMIYIRNFYHFFKFQNKINHTVLKDLLDPIKELYEDVRRKALMRLEYEGLHKSEAITTPGVRFYNDPAGYAMNRYAYYVCYKCKKV